MDNIKYILKEATQNQWPYPKTFEALKATGLQSYEVRFCGSYHAVFEVTFGTYTEDVLEGYAPLHAAETFCAEGMKNAVIKHVKEQTHYLDFLADAATNGATHYKVDMHERTVTYFNSDESASYQEYVPEV